MKIRRELKFATFEWDDEEKSITIETRSQEPLLDYESETHPINGRIKLNKVYAFSLMRFVVRIAQRNWFRKLVK